jgi:hypothetical protein
VVLRGLAADPDQRWPSMAQMAAAIERRLRRPRRVLALAAAVALVGAAAAVIVELRPPPPGADWKPIELRHDAGDEWRGTVSRDGGTVAYPTDTDLVVEPRAGGPRRQFPLPAEVRPVAALALARAAEQAFVMGGADAGQLWVLDVAAGAWTRRATARFDNSVHPDVGPDGTVLAVVRDGERLGTRLVRIDAAGGVQPIMDAKAPGDRLLESTWSPDGRHALILQARGGTRVVVLRVLDAATGALVEAGLRQCVSCDWLDDHALVCNDGDRALVELPLGSDWRLGAAEDRYLLPPLTSADWVRATASGVLLETSSSRQHLDSIDLEHGGPPRRLDGGSVTDLPVAGWTDAGAMIFAASLGGRVEVMARSPGGRLDVVRDSAAAELPLAVLGARIVAGRFPGSVAALVPVDRIGRVFPDDGALFRVDGDGRPLGPTHGFRALRCAGDRAPPCLLFEYEGERGRVTEWDPDTGARGRERARWSLYDRGGCALAADGHTLARIVRPSGAIELLDLDGGATRELALPDHKARYLAWQPDGALIATGYEYRPEENYVVMRVRDGAAPEILVRSKSEWFLEPRVRPDGKELVVSVTDPGSTYWWFAR